MAGRGIAVVAIVAAALAVDASGNGIGGRVAGNCGECWKLTEPAKTDTLSSSASVACVTTSDLPSQSYAIEVIGPTGNQNAVAGKSDSQCYIYDTVPAPALGWGVGTGTVKIFHAGILRDTVNVTFK